MTKDVTLLQSALKTHSLYSSVALMATADPQLLVSASNGQAVHLTGTNAQMGPAQRLLVSAVLWVSVERIGRGVAVAMSVLRTLLNAQTDTLTAPIAERCTSTSQAQLHNKAPKMQNILL